MLRKINGDLVMLGELAPSSNESIIHKKDCINNPKIFQWNQTSTSSRVIQRDVKQLITNINVLGGLFHHLPSIWASNLMPLILCMDYRRWLCGPDLQYVSMNRYMLPIIKDKLQRIGELVGNLRISYVIHI